MKKVLAIILALMMVFSLSVSAVAEDKTEDIDIGGESVGTVEVTVADITEKVYSVTVDWKDTSLSYMKNDGVWNPETHEYEPDEDAEAHELSRWISGSAMVTVTNHSNAPVTATIDYRDITTGTTYSFDKESFDLVTAEGTQVNDAPNNTFTITAETAPDVAGNDTFVVTISPYVEPAPSVEAYTVYGNDRWDEEGTKEFLDVQVNQIIEFYVTNYAQGDTEAYAYLYSATVTSGESANMELIDADHGYNIKFTAAGTYQVETVFKTINGDSEYLTTTLTFTVA